MRTLSSWIDLKSQRSLEVFGQLLMSPADRLGVYTGLSSFNQLMSRLESCEVFVYSKSARRTILKLHDIDSGIPLTVSDTRLRCLLATGKLDPNTPVHLKYLYGGIFAFILTSEIDKETIRTYDTYLYIDHVTNLPWVARLGEFTDCNKLWLESKYDGRSSTLEKMLKIPYITSYSIATESTFLLEDI